MPAPGHRPPTAAPIVALLALGLGLGLALAIAGPSAAARSRTAADGYPTGLQVVPGTLPRSPAPTSLHVEAGTVVDGRRRLRTGLAGSLLLLGRSGTGYVVLVTSTSGTDRALWRIDRDGRPARLRRLGSASADGGLPILSADGRRVAYLAPGSATTRATVLRVRDGRSVGAHRFHGQLLALDFHRRLLLSGTRPTRTVYWDPGDGAVTTAPRSAGSRQLIRADVFLDRAVTLVDDPAGPGGVCVDWTRLSDAARVLWHSCADVPVRLSPSGALMLTTQLSADGPGPGLLQVRDADTSVVRATFRTTGYFGDWSWESDKAVLLTTWRNGRSSAVRFTLAADLPDGGTLERVSALVPGTLGDNRLEWSFPPR